MNGEADRRERITAVLARFEKSKAKRGKRESFKLFSLDEPQREREERRKGE